MTISEHPSLEQPALLEVIPHDQADASVQATREKLGALQSRVDELGGTLRMAEDRALGAHLRIELPVAS